MNLVKVMKVWPIAKEEAVELLEKVLQKVFDRDETETLFAGEINPKPFTSGDIFHSIRFVLDQGQHTFHKAIESSVENSCRFNLDENLIWGLAGGEDFIELRLVCRPEDPVLQILGNILLPKGRTARLRKARILKCATGEGESGICKGRHFQVIYDQILLSEDLCIDFVAQRVLAAASQVSQLLQL